LGKNDYCRRGAAAPTVAIALVVLLGFAALTIDGGRLYVARTELQRAADAGALAAALSMMPDTTNDYKQDVSGGYQWASSIAESNICMGKPVGIVAQPGQDVTFGWLDKPTDQAESFSIDKPLGYYNAVRVLARRTDSSPGGGILLTLANMWGFEVSDVSASAVAVLDDRVVGYMPPADAPNRITPFAILKSDEENPEDTYEWQKVNGEDNFGYNENTGVTGGADGIPEVRLYPTKNDGPGNFGTLNIGVDNLGTSDLENQIFYGVTREQLLTEIGTPMLTFKDEAGNPTSYTMTGNTGISVGMEDTVQACLGTVIGFFLYTVVEEQGSNAIYTIVDIRFGRVVDVHLTGNNKRIVVQPENYQGPEVQTDPEAPHNHLEVCRLMLVR
ncbi:MAG: pilus assembly protein TadG-related protein, partial [Planctomycetota bacterium]